MLGLLGGTDGAEVPSSAPVADTAASDAPESPASASPEGTGDGEGVDTMDRSAPVGVRIPAIGVDATRTVPLGIQPSGEIEVPEDDWTIGWYEGGPTPGQFGPALMGAHVDSAAGPAVFHDLAEVEPGDEVMVPREDGTTAVFTVYQVEQHPKDAFPTRKVYAPTNDRAELRLVTCGGTFDSGTGHYRDNVIVYAELTGTR